MDTKKRYDLAERTARFAEDVSKPAKELPLNAVTSPLVSQLVRAARSIGANTCEANDAVSRKDFRNKIGICRKEASETKYWLRMVARAAPAAAEEARGLWKEAHELHPIFGKSFATAGKPPKATPSAKGGRQKPH